MPGPAGAASSLDGATPLGVQPGKNPDGAHLHRARRHDLHAPKAVVVDRGNVDRPNRAGRGDQAAEALFPTNAQQMPTLSLLACRPLGGRISHGRLMEIAFAFQVPIEVLVSDRLCHSIQAATEWHGSTHYFCAGPIPHRDRPTPPGTSRARISGFANCS